MIVCLPNPIYDIIRYPTIMDSYLGGLKRSQSNDGGGNPYIDHHWSVKSSAPAIATASGRWNRRRTRFDQWPHQVRQRLLVSWEWPPHCWLNHRSLKLDIDSGSYSKAKVALRRYSCSTVAPTASHGFPAQSRFPGGNTHRSCLVFDNAINEGADTCTEHRQKKASSKSLLRCARKMDTNLFVVGRQI